MSAPCDLRRPLPRPAAQWRASWRRGRTPPDAHPLGAPALITALLVSGVFKTQHCLLRVEILPVRMQHMLSCMQERPHGVRQRAVPGNRACRAWQGACQGGRERGVAGEHADLHRARHAQRLHQPRKEGALRPWGQLRMCL